MKSGAPAVVHNLYDWLPGYGENEVSISSTGLEARVTVVYENDSGEGLWTRTIEFAGVCCMYKASFPGPFVLPIALEPRDTLGALVEFPESDAARAWNDHFGGNRTVRHFGVWFLAENSTVQVFGESFRLTDPVPV